MGSTGAWANSGSDSITGVDGIDLWVGGLAENTNPFGGLLGTTFNYVFENQLTNLQNGDRFYYLARTPGMNLRTQLEGNSFAELMMRNTTAHSLKADSFATADCKFQLGSNPGIAGPITGTSIVDDPTSECNENALLIRMPGWSDPLPPDQQRRSARRQRSERVQRNCRCRQDLRRQRQRHVPRQRGQ